MSHTLEVQICVLPYSLTLKVKGQRAANMNWHAASISIPIHFALVYFTHVNVQGRLGNSHERVNLTIL